MAKTRSMTRNQSHDDACSRKRIKTCDKGVVAHWSGLNNDVLFLVMMNLGVIDFISFSGVCKSWRSYALSNRKDFMGSRPPMSIMIQNHAHEKKGYCYLQDFERRRFKTVLPHSAGRKCVGLTCGYLVLFARETKDFWLVNPITSHQLHFPNFPYSASALELRGILVFSPSVSDWVFVVVNRFSCIIWFSVAGKGAWNHVYCDAYFLDVHAFKGKIYTLNNNEHTGEGRQLYEMRIGPEPKLMLLKTKTFPKTQRLPEFVSLDENLHMMQIEYESESKIILSGDISYKVHQLDFGEMKWLYREKANEEYAFFTNTMNYKKTAVKREWLTGIIKSRKDRSIYAGLWYFPHDCLNVNLIDE